MNLLDAQQHWLHRDPLLEPVPSPASRKQRESGQLCYRFDKCLLGFVGNMVV